MLMTPIRILLVSSILALVATAPLSAQRGTPDPEREAVRQLIMDLATHIQAGNLGAIDSLFRGRGVHILTDNATTHGWAEYRDAHLKPELSRYNNLKLTHSSVEPQVRGNVAWVAFRQELTGDTPTGAAQVSGRASAVLEKLDGRWRIVHLHVSR
jgi:ketosteroid isomerase-like protein